MANYAFVENNSVVGVYDLLPKNWKNISNFFVLENETEHLKSLGWYKLEKIIPTYNTETQKLGDPFHWFENDIAYESLHVISLPPPPPPTVYTEEELEAQRVGAIAERWKYVREERDLLMKAFEWRYQRYDREVRLNLSTTDNLSNMDAYMQALADITTQSDPFNLTWPTYVELNAEEP